VRRDGRAGRPLFPIVDTVAFITSPPPTIDEDRAS